ncbi:hypothetical protein Hanom_Chr11g01007701 [Helianthus anomalus]
MVYLDIKITLISRYLYLGMIYWKAAGFLTTGFLSRPVGNALGLYNYGVLLTILAIHCVCVCVTPGGGSEPLNERIWNAYARPQVYVPPEGVYCLFNASMH